MATIGAPSETVGLFAKLRDGASAAGKLVTDMELDKKLTPAMEQGRRVASTGLKAASDVSTKAREVVTSEALWEEQHALVEQLIDVLALQQGLIEDLRSRVAELEVTG